MNRICPHCKSPVPEEANFCLNCCCGNIRNVDEIHKTQLMQFLRENGCSGKGKKLR